MASREQGEHGRRWSLADRAEMERRLAAGETRAEVAAAIGCDARTVYRRIVRSGGLRFHERRRNVLRLSLAEREEIAIGLAREESAAAIAGRSGRADVLRVRTCVRDLAGIPRVPLPTRRRKS